MFVVTRTVVYYEDFCNYGGGCNVSPVKCWSSLS